MKENKGGRTAADGAVIVARQTVTLSLDQVALDVLNDYMARHEQNFGVAFRAMCRDLSRTTGGHVRVLTAAGAGEVVGSAGGHRKRTTGAAGAVMKKPVLRVVPERNPETGAKWSLIKYGQLQAAADAEYEKAMEAYRAAGGAD